MTIFSDFSIISIIISLSSKVFNKLAFLTCWAGFQFSSVSHSTCRGVHLACCLDFHVHQPAKEAGNLWALGLVHFRYLLTIVIRMIQSVVSSQWACTLVPRGQKSRVTVWPLNHPTKLRDLKILLCAALKTDFCSAHVNKIPCMSCSSGKYSCNVLEMGSELGFSSWKIRIIFFFFF